MFGYFVVLPAALDFLLGFDGNTFSNNLQAKPFLTFCTQSAGDGADLGAAAVRDRAHAARDREDRRAAANRRLGYFLVVCLAVALPGVDPVTVFFETLPLLILFETSIWLSVLLDRRRDRLAVAHA